MLPSLLSDLGLLPVFLKRLLIRKHTSSIQPSKEQQLHFQKQFFASNNINSNDNLSSWLSSNGFTESEMSLHLYRSLQTEILKLDLFSGKVQSYFLTHKSDFDMCSYSLLRVSSRSVINELYIRLCEEEDTFSSLAEQYSEGPESDSSGFISPRPFSSIHPEIAERLKISRPGQLWQPFEIDSSWILIRLEKKISSSLDPKTTDSILNILFDDWLDAHVSEALKELKSSETLGKDLIIDFSNTTENDYRGDTQLA